MSGEYGDFDLRQGDEDSDQIWGGSQRSSAGSATAASGPSNAIAVTSPVADLQRDLIAVGIRLGAVKPTGFFGSKTEAALREFQCYAKMATVAKEDVANTSTVYVERLAAVSTGAARYAGPVCGVLNAATRSALTHWIKESWRCPVVLDAWDESAKPPVRAAENIWVSDDPAAAGYVVKATDLSGTYRTQKVGEVWPLGQSKRYAKTRGPVVTTDEAEAACEVLPETLIGTQWSSLTAADQSSFRVVRAVAEVECEGFFDIVNAYDSAILSTGIFHFTVQPTGDGELAGVLARLADEQSADYERAIKFYGVDVVPPKKKKARFKLADENDAYDEPSLETETEKQEYAAKLEYLRNWHWVYRTVMMARTTRSFREQQWSEAIARLKLIRGTPIDEALVEPSDSSVDPPVLATIGEAFTSELAIGYLLRWHVNRPSDIRTSRKVGKKVEPIAGSGIVDVIEAARAAEPKLAWDKPTSSWSDKEEAALLQAIETVPKKNVEIPKSLPKIKSFPNVDKHWTMDRKVVTALSPTRGTFQMGAVPPPPPPPTPPQPNQPGQPNQPPPNQPNPPPPNQPQPGQPGPPTEL